MTKQVHRQIQHGRPGKEGLLRPDEITFYFSSGVEFLYEEGTLIVAGEFPLVKIEFFLKILVLKYLSDVLFVTVRGLH